MKQIVFILNFIFFSLLSFCQQTESYTQYIFNQFALNPAVAGTADCPDIKMGGKLQWSGFENAPQTFFISGHGALKPSRNATSWHGVGAYIVDDRAGMFSRTQFNLAYAYHLKISIKYIASFGFYLGARNQKFRGIQSSIDPNLTPTSFLIFPDVSLGGLLYSEHSFIGLSAKQVLKRAQQDFRGNSIGDSKAIVQYYLTAGTRIESKTYVYTYVPSILLKYGRNTPLSVDMSLLVYGEQNKFGLGVNIRAWESLGAIVESKLTKKIWFGYAYDYPINKVKNGTWGSHELILKIDPCGSGKTGYGGVHCPVF